MKFYRFWNFPKGKKILAVAVAPSWAAAAEAPGRDTLHSPGDRCASRGHHPTTSLRLPQTKTKFLYYYKHYYSGLFRNKKLLNEKHDPRFAKDARPMYSRCMGYHAGARPGF